MSSTAPSDSHILESTKKLGDSAASAEKAATRANPASKAETKPAAASTRAKASDSESAIRQTGGEDAKRTPTTRSGKAVAGASPAAAKPDKTLQAGKAEKAKPAEPATEDPPPDADPTRKFVVKQAAPAWMISMLVHVLLLLTFALMTISNEERVVNVLSASGMGEEGPEIEDFAIDPLDDDFDEVNEEVVEEIVDTPEPMEEMAPVDVETPLEMVSVPISIVDLASQMAPVADSLQTLSSTSTSEMGSRTSAEVKKQMLRTYGGNDASEAAVAMALKWLARHQAPNGAWNFNHHLVRPDPTCDRPGDLDRALNGATGLALLPFLGAGQTHIAGEHKRTVERGLAFLMANGKAKNMGGLPVLDFTAGGGSMYSHGLVAIALCEAYAMTEDPRLAAPAQGALNYIMYAQDPVGGGWRYSPRQAGDTSAVGWQLMALKSGYMGHLTVQPASIRKASLFLDSVQSDGGALYGYTGPVSSRTSHKACHAVGLLCRMYLGWDKNHPGIIKGVENLSKFGLVKNDIYYNYYTAQVLRQFGGPEWEKFNVALRDWLVAEQAQSGGAKGSWAFPNAGHGTSQGGRLYMTAMATMILEVYYRHMPLYSDSAADDEFPL